MPMITVEPAILEASDEEENVSDDLHVYPTFGRAHELRWNCWCRPQGDWENGRVIWLHEVYH